MIFFILTVKGITTGIWIRFPLGTSPSIQKFSECIVFIVNNFLYTQD